MYDIALVGAGGFLGGAIGRVLSARGHRVLPFMRSTPLLIDGAIAPSAVHASVVVWAAGGASPTVAAERPDLVAAELADFRRAMECVAALVRQPRVILLSSGGTVYGAPDRPPFAEADRPYPANAYGRYKLAEEHILQDVGLNSTALRIANAYGPGQRGMRGQGVLAVWMRSILSGQPIRIHGSGAVARDYVFADDVAAAVELTIASETAPRALNIGSGLPTALDDLLAALTRVVGDDHVVTVDRLPSRGVDAASTWLDVSLAKETLGWTAAVPLEEGIARMWKWMADA